MVGTVKPRCFSTNSANAREIVRSGICLVNIVHIFNYTCLMISDTE